ncbi:MAG: hypothetical protein ACRD0G_01580 [Acidimicrobiales bacterium]
MLGSAYCERCGWSVLGTPPPETGSVQALDRGVHLPAPTPIPPMPSAPPRPPPLRVPQVKVRSTALPAGCGVTVVVVVLLTVFAVVGGIVAAVRSGIDEFSGPDTLEAGVLPLDRPVDGEVDDNQQAEYRLVGDGRVVLTVVPDGDFDPVVVLFDAAGTQVGRDDDGGPGLRDSLLVAELRPNESYRVRVEEFSDDGGSYTITARSAVRRAELSGLGSAAAGEVAEEEMVRYPLDLAVGRDVTISVAAVEGFDPTVRVLSHDGEELAFNDDFQGCCDAQVTLVVPDGAVAEVAGLNGRAGRYTITVTCVPGAC